MTVTTPTIQDIFEGHFFEDPLVPIGAEPTPAENAALATALLGYSRRSGPDDFSSVTDFLEAYPESPWNAALLSCLGLEYYNTGNYSNSLEAWRQAWELLREVIDPRGKALADRAAGELAYMFARLGRMAELGALLKSVEGRVFCGSATEKITGAREGLWTMQHRPEIAFRCGPLALHRIKTTVDPENPGTDVIHNSVSTQRGFSLLQVAELSQELGLDFQMAYREKGANFIVPSVVHLKLDHYAAIVRQEGDRYLLQDPTFGNETWITGAALDAETSGYFLIPSSKLPYGWRTVQAQEAEKVWGKGEVGKLDPEPHGPCDPSSPGGDQCPQPDPACTGIAKPRVHLLLVSLNINDEPVGYTPPVGPAIRFIVRYNQREASHKPPFDYSNFGFKWTFDWLSYITDDPSNPAAAAKYYMMGGGTRTFTDFDIGTQTYAFQQYDQTKLTRTSTSPISYEMLSRDGSKKIFNETGGAIGTSRKIFLSELIDPTGNKVKLIYDKLRVVTITDEIGQETTISYDNPADIFKITKVTDPFGRSANFDYDASGRLIKITDVIGITSEFTYDAGDFIKSLTTPYGITTFTKTENGIIRSLETVYPDGERDRVEFNQYLTGIPDMEPTDSVPTGMATANTFLTARNTFYWDKQACAFAYGDYTKARLYHWLHTTNITIASGILESVKEPLEGRVWYDYAGQNPRAQLRALVVGSTNKPAHVGRVLDNGSTQLYTYEYNGFGNVTKTIDPVGRTFSYIYADNGIDLLEIRQTRAGQNELLSQTTYNTQHLPLTSTDAAGQTTTYTYNARGQVSTVTNALGDVTTYHYDANSYRTSVVGPLGDTTKWTYDAFGRVRTATDVSGYTLTFDYDDLDRLKKVTYPDSTFEEFTYTLLDITLMRDRAGRQTSFAYNSVRQMKQRTDPLNQVIYFQWCKCGTLKTLTDPMGRTTTWRHDLRGRVKCKEYADGSKITYLYDNASRLRQRIDEQLQVTKYDYNRDNTLNGKSYTNTAVATPPVTFVYDSNYHRVISMTDGSGTTRYRYIPIAPMPTLGAGQLASVDGPMPNDTITYGYDALGRRLSTAVNGVKSTKTFDAIGRVKSITNALGAFTYTYYGASLRLWFQNFPNGQSTEYQYEGVLQDNLLQRITNKNGSTPISEFIYSHNVAKGQIATWSQQSGTQTPTVFSFGYDPVDQLTSATLSQGASVLKTFTYSYDPAGNRLTEQIDGATTHFFYNALNELTSSDNTSEAAATYAWDAEQRLANITSGSKNTEFTYDGLGRCVQIRQVEAGSEVSNRRIVWCDDDICEERTASGAVSKRFFVQGVQLTDKSSVLFYTHDHIRSIRELCDSTGAVRARYVYEPFGVARRLEGDVLADFTFASMFWVREVGLRLTLFRAYTAAIGRWLSRDSLKNAEINEGVNLFAYVRNNPVNRIDALGAQSMHTVDMSKFEECLKACGECPNPRFDAEAKACKDRCWFWQIGCKGKCDLDAKDKRALCLDELRRCVEFCSPAPTRPPPGPELPGPEPCYDTECLC